MSASTLSLMAPATLPEVPVGCDLAGLVIDACIASAWTITDGDCFVFAQKIVSKAEGRYVCLDEVKPGPKAIELAIATAKDARLVELILAESRRVVRALPGLLITEHRLGHILANAGIDQSNVPDDNGRERALLLPQDPDQSASGIARDLLTRTGCRVGVLINDSFGRPWRQGVCGTAIGVYGLPALVDKRGTVDREGRIMQATLIAVADEVAAAASILMGQADEGRPLVCIRGLHTDWTQAGMQTIHRPAQTDLFR